MARPNSPFQSAFRFEAEGDINPNDVRSYAEIALLPAAGRACETVLKNILARADADNLLPELLRQFTALLHRALAYLEYFGLINEEFDRTFSVRPSIDDHQQNTDHEEWGFYVHALKTVWERVAATDCTRAREEVSRWKRLTYPIFRRFVLWSAGKPGGVSADEAALFILQQPASTLWGLDTRRELLQCLRTITRELSPAVREQLITAILAGPPRDQFLSDISADEFSKFRDRAIHLRLSKMEQGGSLGDPRTEQAWNEILARRPDWTLETSEREEFVTWVGDDFVLQQEILPSRDWYSCKTDPELIKQFTQAAPGKELSRLWHGLVRADITRAFTVAHLLANAGVFDEFLWSLVFESVSVDDHLPDAIRLYAAVMPQLGNGFVVSHLSLLTGAIHRFFRSANRGSEESAWILWDLTVGPAAAAAPAEGVHPAVAAHSSPMGNLAEVLLVKIGESEPKEYQQVPQALQTRLESLLAGSSPGHRLGRVVLAGALAWLHRLKAELIEPAFLSRLDWSESDEARALWIGYLMRPQITPEFWPHLRPLLLKVFPQSGQLGEYENQLYSFFAFLLLHADYELDSAQARHALSVGSARGRAHVAWYWCRQADSATDYGASLYRERLKYLLTNIWPLERELREEETSEHLARLATCCSSEFPDAVTTVLPLISKVETRHDFIWPIKEKGVADRYPEATLTLLDGLIGNHIEHWIAPYLREVLGRLLTLSRLAEDPRFRRLDALVQQFE